MCHDGRGNRPGRAGNDARVFLTTLAGAPWDGRLAYTDAKREAPDFTTQNPEYWAHLDWELAECERRGILVMLFPAYIGWNAGEQGWGVEMAANGPNRLRAYGRWIAERYRERGNIVWMAGGDKGNYDASQTADERALLEGIRSIAGQKSVHFSAEWDSETIGTDQPDFGEWMTLNSAYSWNAHVSLHARRAYAHEPVRPAFLLEEPYDEEGPDGNSVNPNATQPVRRFQWWGWLGTIGGYVAGNGAIWPFNPGVWTQHLDTAGARDMAVLNRFIRGIAWWTLAPSGLGGTRNLVPSGSGEVDDPSYVAAAASKEGDLLVAYVPPAHRGPFSLDLASPGRLRWLDPTTGRFSAATNVAAGVIPLNVPGANAAGDRDWALIVDVPRRRR